MRQRALHDANRMVGLLAALLALLALAPAAGAQDQPLPEDNSGTGQYVEPVPDAGGDRPAAPGPRDGPRGSLPPETRADLPAGEEGRALERIATDPGSGAPREDSGSGGADGGEGDGRGGGSAPAGAGDDQQSAVGAVVSAVADTDQPGLAVVLLAGLGLTLVAAVAALRRRRT